MLTKKDIDIIIAKPEPFELEFLNEFQIINFETFCVIKPLLKGSLYWSTLSQCLIGSSYPEKYDEQIKSAFESREPGSTNLMTKSELHYLKSLPLMISIYRPMTESESKSFNYGASWYADYDTAATVANHRIQTSFFSENIIIKELQVNKKDIIAFIERSDDYNYFIYISKNRKERWANHFSKEMDHNE